LALRLSSPAAPTPAAAAPLGSGPVVDEAPTVPPVESPEEPAETFVPDSVVAEVGRVTETEIAAAEAERAKFGERGIGTLRLRLVSETSGKNLWMQVRLWRLGLSENAAWTAGDAEIWDTLVPEEGGAFDRLASGRYRVQCLDLRSGASDPPEFRVGDGATELTLRVAERRRFRERLLLVDERGSPIASAKTRIGPGSSSASREGTPSWASPRRPKIEGGTFGSGTAIGCGPGQTQWTDTSAGKDGFHDLGDFGERGRSGYRTWSSSYSPDGVSTVSVRSSDAATSDATFVGVAPCAESILATLTRADGAPIDAASAKVVTTCDAVRGPWDAPADAWRKIPVTVSVGVDGCESLEFVWTAADASNRRVLVPLAK
jgi:hypothetical protein